MDKVLKVLVVDDSAYVRKVIKQMLTRSPFIEVVGAARDGKEALEMVEQLQPDVVTCDLIMPGMDGVEFIREQMARRSIPVVVMSIANESGEMALNALDAGAVDFVQKPTALATEKIFEVSDELISKVKAAASAPMSRAQSSSTEQKTPLPLPHDLQSRKGEVDVVVIGISTGGPQALKQMIPQIPADFPVPLAIVMHMPLGYTELYARRLNELSALEFIEAREGEELRAGMAVLAPAGRHLTLKRDEDGQIVTHLDARPFDTLHRPSVDVLFQSAAEVFKNRVLGVVMTGMGSDGKQGAAWIKSMGGIVLTEAEESCVVYGMPASVVEAGLTDKIVPLDQMAQTIIEII